MQSVETAAAQLQGTVKDLLIADVKPVFAKQTLGEVAEFLSDGAQEFAVVVDQDMAVIGLVQQRDVLRHLISQASSKDELPNVDKEVRTILPEGKPLTVTPSLSMLKAAGMLLSHRLNCLPVVGTGGKFAGVVTSRDLLRKMLGRYSLRVESQFELFYPPSTKKAKNPAYIRKINGELVIPLSCMTHPEFVTRSVMLGYDPPSGRILVKFVCDQSPPEGALPARISDQCLNVKAHSFVYHFKLAGKFSAFDVECLKENRYLVLSPRNASLPATTKPGSSPANT
jgi:CBS domain-containing protein